MKTLRFGIFSLLTFILISGCETIHPWETSFKALRGQPIETAVRLLGPPSGSFPTERGTAFVWTTETIDFKTHAGITDPTQGAKSLFQLNVNKRGIISGWKMRQVGGELVPIQEKLSAYVDHRNSLSPKRFVQPRNGNRADWNWLDTNPHMPPADGTSTVDGRGGK